MKVEVIWEEDDYGERQRLVVDGKSVATVVALCECPEDATIGRDLIDCDQIAAFMRQAYIAGCTKDEEFVHERTKGEV